MTRPLIGIAAAAEELDGVEYSAVRQKYISAVTDAHALDVTLLVDPSDQLLDVLDGVILGGHQSNVDPGMWGGRASSSLRDPHRDRLFPPLVQRARAKRMPVLGICRGHQELNVALGGTLRHISGGGHREDDSLPRDAQYHPTHRVEVAPGGILEKFGIGAEFWVNSLHTDALSCLSPALRAEAVADDGIVEAVSSQDPHWWALGVQWHPEWHLATDVLSQKIFEAFSDAALRYRSTVHSTL